MPIDKPIDISNRVATVLGNHPVTEVDNSPTSGLDNVLSTNLAARGTRTLQPIQTRVSHGLRKASSRVAELRGALDFVQQAVHNSPYSPARIANIVRAAEIRSALATAENDQRVKIASEE